MLTVLKTSFRPVILVGSVEVEKTPPWDVLQFGSRAFGISANSMAVLVISFHYYVDISDRSH